MPFCFYKSYQRINGQHLYINIKYVPMRTQKHNLNTFLKNTTTLKAYIIKSVLLCISLCFNKICNSPLHCILSSSRTFSAKLYHVYILASTSLHFFPMAFGNQSLSSLYSKRSLRDSYLANSLVILDRVLFHILGMF